MTDGAGPGRFTAAVRFSVAIASENVLRAPANNKEQIHIKYCLFARTRTVVISVTAARCSAEEARQQKPVKTEFSLR